MKFRDLKHENPNHHLDEEAVKVFDFTRHYSQAKKSDPDLEGWLTGKMTLADWIDQRFALPDFSKLNPGERERIDSLRLKLLEFYWEYLIQKYFAKELLCVIRYTPDRIVEFAQKELAFFRELPTFNRSLLYAGPLFQRGLDPQVNYEVELEKIEEKIEHFGLLNLPSEDYRLVAMLRYREYLKRIVAEGYVLQKFEIKKGAEIAFADYWPEIVLLSNNLKVEYTSQNNKYYEKYAVTNVSGYCSGWSIKYYLEKIFEPGFDKLLQDIIGHNLKDQIHVLKILNDGLDEMRWIVKETEFFLGGNEDYAGTRYLIKEFSNLTYKGPNDFGMATRLKTRQILAKDMTEYPIAWLEAIDKMERRFEHALNNLGMLNAAVKEPKFDTDRVFKNTFILESEAGMKQGTAFLLLGIGLVTCDHCIRDDGTGELFSDLVIYSASDLKKRPVKIIKSDEQMDLALLKLTDTTVQLNGGLVKGDSDLIRQLDDIGLGGFPNYNFGDSGYFTLGRVTGFRVISSISHIMVSNILVEGNSGGPALNKDGEVIGIASTGSENFRNASKTEKHGIIPINLLNYFLRELPN